MDSNHNIHIKTNIENQIIEKNKTEMNLGGNLQPKKRISVEKDNSQNDFFNDIILQFRPPFLLSLQGQD